MQIVVEICCSSLDDALEAQAGGADRIELCSALFLGGLTPSAGTLCSAVERLRIPIMAMVRPRHGGMCYTQAEFASMERDIELSLEMGATGIVFGVLLDDGRIDVTRSRRLVELAQGAPTMFHRAFDVTPNPFEALDQLIDLGVTRLLTSGQEPTQEEGADLLAELVQRAGDRIEVMPGGGVRPHNVAALVQKTGCKAVHLAALCQWRDTSALGNPRIRYGAPSSPPEDVFDVIDRKVVAEVVDAVRLVAASS